MPLTMKLHGERACPGVICDVCGKDIKYARDGNAQWLMGKEGKGCTIYFTHKACCNAFDTANPGAGAHELSHFLIFLTNNLKVDWDMDKEKGCPDRIDRVTRSTSLEAPAPAGIFFVRRVVSELGGT
jgi:hypothetical protein